MEQTQYRWITNFILGNADDMLHDAPDAWYDPASVETGYEISFTRYFYQPQPLRTLAEIRADILALERETAGVLAEILGGGTP